MLSRSLAMPCKLASILDFAQHQSESCQIVIYTPEENLAMVTGMRNAEMLILEPPSATGSPSQRNVTHRLRANNRYSVTYPRGESSSLS